MEEQVSREFIEFEEIDDKNSITKVARHFFRIPIMEKTDFLLIIGTKTYSIVNISVSGLGALVDPDDSFFLGQILNNCEIMLLKERIKGLTGKITHCSSDMSGQRMCGIKWINPDPQNCEKIESVLLAMQKEMFKKK